MIVPLVGMLLLGGILILGVDERRGIAARGERMPSPLDKPVDACALREAISHLLPINHRRQTEVAS